MNKKILTIVLVSTLFLSSCGKTTTTAPVPTPTVVKKPKLTQITFDKPAEISLTARPDGRELNLTISKIPSEVKKLEYELLYTAKDGKSEIEKGLGDTLEAITDPVERKLLLGTSSCTNGCKYRYDEGVTGGTLKLTYLTQDNGVNIQEITWTLQKSGKNYIVNIAK